MTISRAPDPAVAVILPAYNEAAAIAGVVADFGAALPRAKIYVYDNNSTDETAAMARAAGALVRRECAQGKGNVIRRALANIEADIYLVADADGTYDAAAAPQLLATLVDGGYDMVVGVRDGISASAFRNGHRLGNRLFNLFLRLLFERRFTDIFSGYRVLSRRFVKSFPAMSRGFEIETELSLHAMQLGAATAEVPTHYGERPMGSASKLHTWRDGLRILWTMLRYVMHYRPLLFYTSLSALLASSSVALGVPVVAEYLDRGVVPRLPTALLATAIMLVAGGCLASGLILDNIRQGLVELKRLQYLHLPAVAEHAVLARAAPASSGSNLVSGPPDGTVAAG